MNGKQAKKIRKAIERAKPDVVQMFTSLRRWPFRMRLKMAWLLIIGLRKQKPSPRT